MSDNFKKLRSALVDLVGEEDPEALKEMIEIFKELPTSDEDKTAMINAAQVLIDTAPA